MINTLFIAISNFYEKNHSSFLSVKSDFNVIMNDIAYSCSMREIDFTECDDLQKKLKKCRDKKLKQLFTSKKIVDELIQHIDSFDSKHFANIDDLRLSFNMLNDDIDSANKFNLLSKANSELLFNMQDMLLNKKLSYFTVAQLNKYLRNCKDETFSQFIQKHLTVSAQLNKAQKTNNTDMDVLGSVHKTTDSTTTIENGDSALCNTAEKSKIYDLLDSDNGFYQSAVQNCTLISVNGQILPVCAAAKVDKNVCKLDWCSISFCISELSENAHRIPYQNENAIRDIVELYLPEILENLYGLELGEPQGGMLHYKFGWKIVGDCGVVLAGHKTNRVLIQLTGRGCTLAKTGWNQRTYEFISKAKKGKIVRLDICLDDLTGEKFDVDLLDALDTKGLFNCGGRQPEVEHVGNWKSPNGKGRTFAIGVRGSAKYFRGYERGKKLGDKNSEWARAEIEFIAAHAYLPFEMLIEPDSYFAGAYPAAALLLEMFDSVDIEQQRIEYIKKESQITIQKSFEIMDHQFGSYFAFCRNFMTDSEILDLVTATKKDKPQIPKRLQFSSYAAMILTQNNEIILSDNFNPLSFVNEKQHVSQTLRN